VKDSLRPGLEHQLTFQVPVSKTVPALFPESAEFQAMPEVFATGFLVGLLEWACIELVNPHLDWPAEQTVGTHIDVSHAAATPPGLHVTVTARLTEVDRRRLAFDVEARDEVDLISRGTHHRAIIDAERFTASVQTKAASRP
jgi:fluoroacetyl-CoA thioesterase